MDYVFRSDSAAGAYVQDDAARATLYRIVGSLDQQSIPRVHGERRETTESGTLKNPAQATTEHQRYPVDGVLSALGRGNQVGHNIVSSALSAHVLKQSPSPTA